MCGGGGLLGQRVDVRTYLLGGAIDGSEAKRIIRDPKLELESSRFTFDLVPLSYESVDELQGEGWFEWVHGDDVAKTVFRMRNGHVEVYGYAFWVNQCTSGFHGVNEPGGVRVAREDDRGVTEGREDVRKVFQQRRSGAKRKLSRCGRNQMGNEPILALPEGADDFVVYYDVRSNDLEACLEKGRRLTNRWLSMKKDIASCGSKYLAYSDEKLSIKDLQDCGVYHSSMDVASLKHGMRKDVGTILCSRIWSEWVDWIGIWYKNNNNKIVVIQGLTSERCSTFRKKDKLEPSYVGPFEILGWIGPIVQLRISVYGLSSELD
ncbi:hypothetical protein Tco_0533484 [Tanacetum coccineum]